jgi:hypothetical protein
MISLAGLLVARERSVLDLAYPVRQPPLNDLADRDDLVVLDESAVANLGDDLVPALLSIAGAFEEVLMALAGAWIAIIEHPTGVGYDAAGF